MAMAAPNKQLPSLMLPSLAAMRCCTGDVVAAQQLVTARLSEYTAEYGTLEKVGSTASPVEASSLAVDSLLVELVCSTGPVHARRDLLARCHSPDTLLCVCCLTSLPHSGYVHAPGASPSRPCTLHRHRAGWPVAAAGPGVHPASRTTQVLTRCGRWAVTACTACTGGGPGGRWCHPDCMPCHAPI
jgi:hypothetical protein